MISRMGEGTPTAKGTQTYYRVNFFLKLHQNQRLLRATNGSCSDREGYFGPFFSGTDPEKKLMWRD